MRNIKKNLNIKKCDTIFFFKSINVLFLYFPQKK